MSALEERRVQRELALPPLFVADPTLRVGLPQRPPESQQSSGAKSKNSQAAQTHHRAQSQCGNPCPCPLPQAPSSLPPAPCPGSALAWGGPRRCACRWRRACVRGRRLRAASAARPTCCRSGLQARAPARRRAKLDAARGVAGRAHRQLGAVGTAALGGGATLGHPVTQRLANRPCRAADSRPQETTPHRKNTVPHYYILQILYACPFNRRRGTWPSRSPRARVRGVEMVSGLDSVGARAERVLSGRGWTAV
jgi:hypothetical protein